MPSRLTEIIWKDFYETIQDNVSSVTIKGSGGANTKTVTVQSYTSAFPQFKNESADDYPIIVISSPTGNFSNLTFRDSLDDGRIVIEIYATQAEAADKLKDAVRYALMSNDSVFSGHGIDDLDIEDEDSSEVLRGKINVHVRKMSWRFTYAFTW